MTELKSFYPSAPPLEVPEDMADAFRQTFRAMDEAGIRFSLDGGLPTYLYTGICRDVHDLDLRVLPEDVQPALQALRSIGFEAGVKHEPWLAQGFRGEIQVDLVFGLGTWHAWVDPIWFSRGRPVDILGQRVLLAPVEEIFWSKAYRCSRWAYDGNDLFQLIEAVGEDMDWEHLLWRFGDDWEVLFSHLIMYRYVFPSRMAAVPDRVLDALAERFAASRRAAWPDGRICRGHIIDSSDTYDQYYDNRGFIDVREQVWERQRAKQRAVPSKD